MHSTLTAIATGTFLLALSATMGCHGHCAFGDDPKNVSDAIDQHVGKTLDLVHATPQQRAEISPIVNRLAPEIYELARAHNQLHSELVANLSRSEPDRARIDELIDGLGASAIKMCHHASAALFDIHAVLSDEQRATLSGHLSAHTKEP